MAYNISNDVIRRAQNGDEDARREIFELFRHPIRVTMYRYLGGRFPADIDDFVQDVFMKIFTHIGSFDFSRNVKFSTWTYTFVRNYCFDKLKRKRLPTFSMSAPNRNDEDPGEWIGKLNPPEKKAERNELAGALRHALSDLPSELRRIFRLREFEGWEFRAIARRLKLPLGTVKSKHYRALDRLRYMLRSFQPAC